MKRTLMILTATVLCLSTMVLFAQAPAGQAPAGGGQRGPAAPPQPMSFFIASAGSGDGANLGGLTGGDAICQRLATAAGSTKTFHAYLSTQAMGNQPAVNARDRIGTGPWYNANGQLVAMNLAILHGDTIEQARTGNALGKQLSLTEKKTVVNGVGDMPNQHDILTGSTSEGKAFTDGMDHTCGNWTSNTAGMGSAQLGHSDKQGGGNSSWNSTHASRGCSQANLVSTGGAGLLYCFAIN